jgi:hypothetical protein
MWLRVAGTVLAALLFASSASADTAETDERHKQGWERAFEHIESSFTEGVLIDTTLSLSPRWVPYVAQARKILARAANNLVIRLKPLGIDPHKYIYTEFDGIQIMRVAYALEWAKRGKQAARTSGELLAYSLCPWQIPQCTNEVKAAIYARRGWKA